MAPTLTAFSHPCELEPALARVVAHYTRRLRHLLDLSPDDVADVRQDLYVAVLGALPKFDPSRACLPTFLDRVLRSASTDILRRTLRERAQVCALRDVVFVDHVLDDLNACDITGDMVGIEGDADRRYAAAVATAAVDCSLALEAFQRTLPLELLVIFRGLMGGLNASEIARQLGIGESLVRYRVKKLRKAFLNFGLWTTPPSGERPREA